MASATNICTNGPRLWESLEEMAKIGPGVAGGNNRQTLTDADGEARHLFKAWCEAAGCTVRVDQMGSMFATRAGTDPEAAPVFMGSHLDTQPTGGKYDGVLGVLAGLEVLRTMDEMNLRTKHPITLVNWTNEEGARFAPAMVASGVFVGALDLDYAYSRTDEAGKTFGEELARIGWIGPDAPSGKPIHAMFEYHIEQGPILEAEGIDIGVVTHTQGMWWLKVTVTGKAAHAGATPMAMRKNAGLGAARLMELVQTIAVEAVPSGVGNVGFLELSPNSINVVPDKAVFKIDFRAPLKDTLNGMRARFEAEAPAIAEALGLGLEIEVIGHFDPVAFDEPLAQGLRRACEDLGYSHRDIVSGAGHDACYISSIAPTVMIFCPCVDGLSHNEAEAITPEWARKGCDVLLRAVLETAQLEA